MHQVQNLKKMEVFYDDINKVLKYISAQVVAIKNGKKYYRRIRNRKCQNIS